MTWFKASLTIFIMLVSALMLAAVCAAALSVIYECFGIPYALLAVGVLVGLLAAAAGYFMVEVEK